MILTNNPEDALNREIALRAHIDYIVRDYALENICTDHIEWTHKKVSKVSVFLALLRVDKKLKKKNKTLNENLKPIPVTPKTQLILPQDPFDTLRRDWDLDAIKTCFEPHWTVEDPQQLVDHMRSVIGPSKRKRSELVWSEKDQCAHVVSYLSLEFDLLTEK
jgi:hypothetical protein